MRRNRIEEQRDLFDPGKRAFPTRPGPVRDALLGAEVIDRATQVRGLADEPNILFVQDLRTHELLRAAEDERLIHFRSEGSQFNPLTNRSEPKTIYASLTGKGYQLLAETGRRPHAIEWVEFSPYSPKLSPIAAAQRPRPKAPATKPSPQDRKPLPRTSRTFAEARTDILDLLKEKGWDLSDRGLKIPYATSPNGRLRLWFKPQAVWYTEGRHRADHPFSRARSTSDIDIRLVTPEVFLSRIRHAFPIGA